MKIDFPDKSYIECRKLDTGRVVIIISALDGANDKKKITNTVELDATEFHKLISDVQV